MYFINAMKS